MALSKYVRPVAYCEIEPYCQSVLLQRMQEGNLPKAPIWDDIRTLSAKELPRIDIIYGGFPCQDISVAGAGKGLEGERSGLFFEIMRLVREIAPTFVFLENVPAIRTRGLDRVLQEFTKERYDCRWTMLSAAEVGAMHRRERWFLLAKSRSQRCDLRSDNREKRYLQDDKEGKSKEIQPEWDKREFGTSEICSDLAHSKGKRLERQWGIPSMSQETFSEPSLCGKDDKNSKGKSSNEEYKETNPNRESWRIDTRQHWPFESRADWQKAVSRVCRTADGVPSYVDRIKALGNSVVPMQVREAFRRLMGIEKE